MNQLYTPPRDTIFDKYGDLTLKVGEPPTNYQVSSTVLARASPVFDAMLNGGFMESGPGIGDWVVRLPADGAKEVRIFLAIIHSNLAAGPVPNGMPLGELHRMLAFADKYDVTAKIYPWAERWMEAVKSEVEDPRLLAGAWELGDVSTVDMMVKRLAYKCRADQNGNLIYRRSAYDSDEEDALKKYACDTIDGDSKQNDGSADENEDEDEGDNQYFSVIPAEALDVITAYRDWLIRNEEIRILDMMKKFVQGTCSQRSYEDRKLCDSKARESFQNSLQSHGVFNGADHPLGFNTLFSVEEYWQILGGLEIALDHEKCQEALEDDLNFDSLATDSPFTVASYGDHNHRLDAVIQKGRLTRLGREWTHTGLARECLCESAAFHPIELR